MVLSELRGMSKLLALYFNYWIADALTHGRELT